jgi:hypothetical protein
MQGRLQMRFTMRLEVLDLTVTYLIFSNGPNWWVTRQAEELQHLGRNLTSKEQALQLAQTDSTRWPGCERNIFSVGTDGVRTVEATMLPGDEVSAIEREYRF